MLLTRKSVKTLELPAGMTDKIFWDENMRGFGLRLRDGSPPTWVYQYKYGTKNRRKTLGELSALEADKARNMAEKLRASVTLGEDPVATIKADKAASERAASNTFVALVPAYIEWQQTRKRKNGAIGVRPRWLYQVNHHLMITAKPLHKMQIAHIDRGDVAKILDVVRRESGSRTSNIVRSTLSAFFRWLMAEGHPTSNPVIGTRREDDIKRERVLLPAELRTIWKTLPADQYGAIVKLLLLTGQREGEIGGLRRSELHNGAAIFPPERTKNRRSHVVPLPKAALAVISEQPLRTDASGRERDLIFGLGDGGYSGWSKSKAKLDETIEETYGKPLPHWTLHDLRRTFATYISGGLPAELLVKLTPAERKLADGLKVQPHVREAILNHVSGYRPGVVGVYDQSTYEAEKKTALNRWAAHLLAIVESRSNVTPFQRRA